MDKFRGLFLTLISLLFAFSSHSQKCFGLFVNNKDYLIEVTPTNLNTPPQYVDTETVTVCGFDNTLKLIKKDGGTMPPIRWKEGGTPTSNSIVATTSVMDFKKGVNKVVIEIEGEKDLSIVLKIFEKIDVNDKETNDLAIYSFDSNKFPVYPSASRGNGIKFLEITKEDQVVLDVKPNKNASNHIWIEPTVPFIPEDIEIDPTQIVPGSKGTVNHTVKHLNNSHFRFHDVSGCSSKIYEIETYLARTVSIDLYTLQESDDDEANYCIDKNGNGIPWESGDVDGSLLKSCKVTDKIMSTDHVCINSGPDGSIDLYAYHTSANWIHPLDAIVGKGHHSAKVIASTDLECQTIPNRIVPGDPSTYPPRLDPVPTGINVAKLQQDLNTIYKKLGISVNVNYHGVISANFDSFLDDNILTGKQEQARYHIQNFGGIPKAGNSVAWIVNDLYKEADTGGKNKFRSRGRGTGFKDNTLTLNYSILVDRTFSHELGHAKFDLGHPDDDHAHDGLENSHSGDKYNFMNSGKIYSSSVHNISLHRLRQYQWEKIFSNL